MERDDRLHHHEQLALLDEGLDDDRFVRLVTETAAREHPEAEALAVLHRNHRKVVQQPLSAV